MAEERRIPLVVLALSPVLLASAHDPPKGPSLRQEAGPQVFVGSYLRHSALFPRARIVAHHGGIGTSGQALKAGRPQLVTPLSRRSARQHCAPKGAPTRRLRMRLPRRQCGEERTRSAGGRTGELDPEQTSRLIVAGTEYSFTIAARTPRCETRGAFLEIIGGALRDPIGEPSPTPSNGPH